MCTIALLNLMPSFHLSVFKFLVLFSFLVDISGALKHIIQRNQYSNLEKSSEFYNFE